MNIQNRKSIVSIRDVVLFITKTYGFTKPRVRRMPQGVIDFNYAVSSGPKQYVFKVFNTRNAHQVDFELSVMQRLTRFGFRSPRPVLATSKKHSSVITGRPCALLGFIPGRILLHPSAKDMAVIGRMLGEFHTRLRRFNQRAKKQTWEPVDIKQYIRIYRGSIVRKKYPNARELISFVKRELSNISFPSKLPQGVTHQDVKPENIIKDARGAIHLIDFDACYRGILLYDVMTPIIWMCFTKKGQLRKQHFQSFVLGYRRTRKFEQKEKKHFYDALRFRLLREAFVWPMRFSVALAKPKTKQFIAAYRALRYRRDFIASLCKT